jgi:hypothetical protein
VSANPVVVVTWIGALAYFVTRAAQTSFYSKFGLEPEDVGLGYAEALSRAAVALLLLILLGASTLILMKILTSAAKAREPAERRAEGEPLRIGPIRWSVVEFSIFTLLILAVWMPPTYTRDAHSVKEGKSLRPAGLSSPLRLIRNPLGLRVESVHVSWIDEERAAYDFGNRRVMYLGRSSGTAVFFDPTQNKTVRVPEGNIVIERTS